MRTIKRTLILVSLLGCNAVFGQNIFSPYTINGIGDLAVEGFANSNGMGGIGIAAPSYYHINSQNPALLIYNTLSVFQMSVAGESREVASALGSQKGTTAGLNYLAFAFPVKRNKWTTSFGVLPFSSVNYSVLSAGSVTGSDTDVTFNIKGDGGITRVYFANGFSLGKGLSAGIRGSYLFGFVNNETTTVLGDANTIVLPTAIFENTTYRGFKLSGGLAYRKEYKENSFLNFGLNFESASDLSGERLIRLERKSIVNLPIPGDTLTSGLEGSFSLPSNFGIGFSWEKLNKFTLGIDISRKNWSQRPGFDTDLDKYRSSWKLNVGMEYIPEFTSVNNYIKRVKYRLGMSYEQVPYISQNTTINDIGINFGWSLPVNVISSLDMAFKVGQRGTTDNGLVKERYFKFVIGATVNDRWFVRRRYD